MTMSHRPSFVARLVTAGVAALLVTAGPAIAQDHPIRGTWIVQVRLLTACTGGAPLPPFWSLLTFSADGGVAGSTLNAAFAPGQRGPDHGQWAPAAGGAVTASTLALVPFATPPAPPQSPGFQAGAQRIDQTITMSGTRAFISAARVTFLDLAGTPYRHGCATATGWRFQ
jgi:hypothetical protein